MSNTGLIKILLLLVAFGLTVILFLWPTAQEGRLELNSPELRDDIEDTAVDDVGSTTMFEPRFMGEDSKNRRWEVKAKEATQQGVTGANAGEVSLKEIEASATTASGHDLSFKAGSGDYSEKGETLSLQDGVTVTGHGYTLTTQSMESDLEKSQAKGDTPVTIHGAGGKLKANSFEILENGDVVRLTGGVKGRFYPKSAQPIVPHAVSPTGLAPEPDTKAE